MTKYPSANVYFSSKANYEKIYYKDSEIRSKQRASRYFVIYLNNKKNNYSSMDGRSAQEI